jgi:uncharacterized protein YbcI
MHPTKGVMPTHSENLAHSGASTDVTAVREQPAITARRDASATFRGGRRARRLPPWQPFNGERPKLNPAAASPAELSKSLTTLWTDYAGTAPSAVRTEIRGNVVTCVLTDAVADFNHGMVTPQTGDTVRRSGMHDRRRYERAAVAAVGRLTNLRVAAFLSSHDGDTDVATEVFTLEPLLSTEAVPAASVEAAP